MSLRGEPWAAWWRRVGEGLDQGAAPGGAVWVSVAGTVVCHAAHGLATTLPEPAALGRDDWFDLASVTKAVSTVSCVLSLVEAGRLELDAPAASHLPELAEHGKAAITVRQLLTHSSGLPPWVHYYETCRSREEVRSAVLATPPAEPAGTTVAYSDVGFLTVGFLVEALTGCRQDHYLRDQVLAPLGLAGRLGYRPEGVPVVATEVCPTRGRLIRGEVHDENAWVCDGVAGHAGLFGTVEGVGRFGQAILHGEIFRSETRAELFRPRDDVAAGKFWLGWKRLQYESGDEGAFGHDGFTGTLLWVCPSRELVVALLTNRVHPTRLNRRIYDLRPGWIAEAAKLAR